MKDFYTLSLIYGTSKGRDTYGYTTCSLREGYNNTRVGFCSGGGYCLKGTVFAEFMTKEFSELIRKLDPKDFHGISYYNDKLRIDGGCGINSMEYILKAIGYELKCTLYMKGGDLQNFTLERKGV